jgi:adenylate cyclase
MDFEGTGLLDGLTGEEREARIRLLEKLTGEGVTLEELHAAVAEERLALVPVERALAGEYSALEVAKRSELPTEGVIRLRRAMGLPDPGNEKVFTDYDIDAARSMRLFLESGFSEQAINQIGRVLGEGMSRLAATITVVFGEAFLKAGDAEDDLALRFAERAQAMSPAFIPVLAAAFRAHLRDNVSRAMLRRSDRQSGQVAGAIEVAVCFADLVGFTRLGGEIEVQQLGTVAGKLGDMASEMASGPVRLVKTIGDAAMFVSREVSPLVEVALSLVEGAVHADMPSLRAGIAYGDAFQRAGDFYGNSVNLASRVTGVARPGSVLCTQEVRDVAADDFDWSFAGQHRLKGVPEPLPLHRARRRGAPQNSTPPRKRTEGRPRRRGSH